MSWQELGNDEPGERKKRPKINFSKSTKRLKYTDDIFMKFRKNIDCSNME